MVSTRLTDGELERLDEERGQSSRSDWIRRLLFGKR